MLEVFAPAAVFIGATLLFKGISRSCSKLQEIYTHRKIQKIIYKKITKKPIDDTCVICLENYTENKKRVQLYCNHNFHKSCMDNWLLERPTCPLCNTALRTKNDKHTIQIIRIY